MDLTSSKLYHEAQKNIAIEVHKDMTSFSRKNESLKALNYLKACKVNAPKMLEKKAFTVFTDATCKG